MSRYLRFAPGPMSEGRNLVELSWGADAPPDVVQESAVDRICKLIQIGYITASSEFRGDQDAVHLATNLFSVVRIVLRAAPRMPDLNVFWGHTGLGVSVAEEPRTLALTVRGSEEPPPQLPNNQPDGDGATIVLIQQTAPTT